VATLKGEKLKRKNWNIALRNYAKRRQVARIYLYTFEQHLQEAKGTHGEAFFEGMRIVLGEDVPTKDGNIKEKGVDALLVADLIYHAASRNCEYDLVVTPDTDFVHALRRVEDFGCGTGVLAVCAQASPRLQSSCDDYSHVTAEELIQGGWASRIENTG
jgi:uncharacterized LabA/DUF88 family protein